MNQKLPQFVSLDGIALRFRPDKNDYFRDSGYWSVDFKSDGHGLISVSSDDGLNGRPLLEATLQQWIDQNHEDISKKHKTTDKLLSAMQAFQLDDPDSALKFSSRLARENGWDQEYALRAVDEYKRFVVLCCIVPGGATPSDAVDQVWHLHMVYTRSYWDDMCDGILGRKLHHGPTKGGDAESTKFDGMYTRTLQAYRETFGQEPPKDIWPTNEVRFSDIDFQRVNLKLNWVIPKPSRIWGGAMAMMAVVFLALMNVQASGLSTNEWVTILIGAALLIIFLVWLFRKGGRGGRGGGGGSCSSGCSVFMSAFGCSSSHSSGCGSSGCGSSGCGSSCGGGD